MGADTKAMSFDNSGATPTSTSIFSTSEEVYVYNSTQGALLIGTLKPTNLSNGDKYCDLTGDLTGDIYPSDELTLYYNAVGFGDLTYPYYIQDGTATGVLDGATATVTVSSTSPSLSTTSAHFNNLASMFRFKFKDETEAPIEVNALTVCSKNNSLIAIYVPLAVNPEEQYQRGAVPIQIASPTTDFLYFSLFFNEILSNSSDALAFVAEDNSYLYLGEKTAPTGGFKNGKYYYNTAPIQLTKMGALQTPTITWTKPSVAQDPMAQVHQYTVDDDNIDIGLTGTSQGYYFFMQESNISTIRLNGLTAAKYDNPFIGVQGGSITLDVSGANSIDCRYMAYGIFAAHSLKLQGSGTLTVTSNLSEFCGLFGVDNYNPTNNGNATTDALDVSTQLAATGYTVTRSARTANADGSYTWTYTVASAAPAAATGHALSASVVGDVVGTDGLAYDVADKDNLPTGVTAAGMVAYKSGSNGLVIALADDGSMIWSTANGATTGAAAHTPAVTGQTWKLPSQAEWKQMFKANGGYDDNYFGLNTAITNAGGTGLQEADEYWSSTEDDPGVDAYSVYLLVGNTYWGDHVESSDYRVRACLAFSSAPTAKAAAEATAEDKGKLIGTDGKIYDDVAAASAAGTPAVAKIIYVGTTGDATYSHGLALALTDEASTMAWQAAIDACSAKNTSTPVTDATWLLASKDQWNYMLGTNGAGSYTALRDGFSGITGASNLQSYYYWSSTEVDEDMASLYRFDTGEWQDIPKEEDETYVRACLAF